MYKKIISIILALSIFISIPVCARAETSRSMNPDNIIEAPIMLSGAFESDSAFIIAEDTLAENSNSNRQTLGDLIISGDLVSQSIYINAIPIFVFNSDQDVTFSYRLADTQKINLVDSKECTVDGVELDSTIGKGSIIVQLSYDGNTWGSPAYYKSNLFSSLHYISNFFRINMGNTENGIFVRIILAYSTENNSETISDKSKHNINHTELYIARIVPDNGTYATGDLSADRNIEIGVGAAVLSDLTISNRVVGEAVFHSTQGHGFAAEAANMIAEQAAGHTVEHTGANNIKNGPDYIVKDSSGVVLYQVQSKYWQTAKQSIESCFDKDTGLFRYYTSDGPMRIEVPNEQYSEAVDRLAEKIKSGLVPGVDNPDKAKDIIKPGEVTYKQAVNIAKAGTVDSLKYDAKNSCVTSTTAFGISATIQFARSIWQHENVTTALKKSIYTGIKVGGISFATSILASQLSRTGLNALLYHGTEELFKNAIGYKAAAVIVNASRVGATPIYGAAAAKSAAKLFSSNIIVGTITLVLFTVPDVIDAFRGRISVKQLVKDTVTTASGVGGGFAGAAGGAALGSALAPGIGTVIGGIVGGIAGAAGFSIGAASISDLIVEDDADKMINIISEEFQVVANDYLLTQEEADKTSDKLSSVLSAKMLKDMYASKNWSSYAHGIIEPIIIDVIKDRQIIIFPSESVIETTLIDTLNEIYDFAEQDN